MDRLRVIPPYGKSFLHTVERDSLVIGRSTSADLHVSDRFLSRRHARLFFADGRWWIEDLASRNGSWLNGRRIDQPTTFGTGDRVRLSNTYLLFGPEPAAAERTPTDFITADHEVSYRPVDELIRSSQSLDPGAFDRADALDMQAERLHLLVGFHSWLSEPVDLEGLLEKILDCSFETLAADQGVIYLKQPNGLYQRAAERSASGLSSEHLDSETLLTKVADEGLTALVNDLDAHPDWQDADSMLERGVLSLLAAPLKDSQGSLGMIALSSNQHGVCFTHQELELLVSLAAIGSLRLRNMLLTEETAREAAELERLEHELHLARSIQVGLLPATTPHLQGFEIHGRSIPCRRVSGDFYQIVPRRDGEEVVVLLSDVVGKGLGASLVTASLEALAVGPIEFGHPPAEICRHLNRRLWARTAPGRFAAAFLASLRADTDRVSYANAGLNPPVLVRAGGRVHKLQTTGAPLGLLEQADYGEKWVRLGPGDLLVLYTDGFTEAENPAAEEYGLQRLIEVCRAHRDRPLATIAKVLERDLEEYADGVPFEDDRALVLVRRST